MVETAEKRLCKRCKTEKELNSDNWYVQRSRDRHPTPGWQSNCRECWREINRDNKKRRRLAKLSNVASGLARTLGLTSAPTKSEPVASDAEKNSASNT